ncbi:UNVERIFIED_CONTAM: hypothetical protein GTU68_020959 [Idotea baltica]|nr:hypothetical protein [Idotea baltica]
MGIPVFHDDQHGTAIVVCAAARNAIELAGKTFEDIKIVSTGGGAAGIACLNMLMKLGVKRENIWLCDIDGLVYEGRGGDTSPEKAAFAQATDARTLDDVIGGAHLFLGLSGPGVLTPEMVAKMAPQPMIFALANPTPEIMPEDARAVSPDALIATGRSDFPNQVNNVLCFPFIFRGALDIGATEINDAMQIACVEAIAELARRLAFGPEYLIPKPFDPRLLPMIAVAVAKAAIESGVATREIDLDAYHARLQTQVYRSAMIMRPVFEAARLERRRIVFAEGEEPLVLRAVQAINEEMSETAILVGRPDVIEARIEREGLSLRPGKDFELVDPGSDSRFRDYWSSYHEIMARRGVTPDLAKAILRTNTTAIAATMVQRDEADSMICGTFGQYHWHLNYVQQILGNDELHPVGALSLIILDKGPLFIADTHVNIEPTAEQLAETMIGAARHVRRFGLDPKLALCSSSQFGNLNSRSGERAREALRLLDAQSNDFEYEGEMHTDAALDPDLRERMMPGNRLTGKANVLIYTNTDAAGAARNLLKSSADGLEVGPILMGMGNRAHIVTPGVTARGLLNIAALAGAPVSSYG